MLSARWGAGRRRRARWRWGLVCGCVFAAVAGPALNLHMRRTPICRWLMSNLHNLAEIGTLAS
jgi:hypothetical protein